MAVAYAWASHRSTCVLCGEEVKRRDGIGIGLDRDLFPMTADSRARWAHARCAATWRQQRESEAKDRAREGYAFRKGLGVPVPREARSLTVSQKFLGRKPVAKRAPGTTRGAEGARLQAGSETHQQPYTADSAYAAHEARVIDTVTAICATGVRINLTLLSELTSRTECSDTVRRVAESLVGNRVFPAFSVSPLTGRVSLRKPALGSLRRDYQFVDRALIVAEPGESLVSIDIGQFEARVVAALCQDPGYPERFHQGRDLYSELAEELLGDASKRNVAKRIVLGLNFGMGSDRLASQAGLSVHEAEMFVLGLARELPVWASWIEETIGLARKDAALTTAFGRTVPVERAKAHTQAVSHVVQATARDIFFTGVLRMVDAGLLRHLRLVLHDEVVLSLPADSAEDLAARAAACMSEPWCSYPGSREVPIEVHVSQPSANWAEAKRSMGGGA